MRKYWKLYENKMIGFVIVKFVFDFEIIKNRFHCKRDSLLDGKNWARATGIRHLNQLKSKYSTTGQKLTQVKDQFCHHAVEFMVCVWIQFLERSCDDQIVVHCVVSLLFVQLNQLMFKWITYPANICGGCNSTHLA